MSGNEMNLIGEEPTGLNEKLIQEFLGTTAGAQVNPEKLRLRSRQDIQTGEFAPEFDAYYEWLAKRNKSVEEFNSIVKEFSDRPGRSQTILTNPQKMTVLGGV